MMIARTRHENEKVYHAPGYFSKVNKQPRKTARNGNGKWKKGGKGKENVNSKKRQGKRKRK